MRVKVVRGGLERSASIGRRRRAARADHARQKPRCVYTRVSQAAGCDSRSRVHACRSPLTVRCALPSSPLSPSPRSASRTRSWASRRRGRCRVRVSPSLFSARVSRLSVSISPPLSFPQIVSVATSEFPSGGTLSLFLALARERKQCRRGFLVRKSDDEKVTFLSFTERSIANSVIPPVQRAFVGTTCRD